MITKKGEKLANQWIEYLRGFLPECSDNKVRRILRCYESREDDQTLQGHPLFSAEEYEPRGWALIGDLMRALSHPVPWTKKIDVIVQELAHLYPDLMQSETLQAILDDIDSGVQQLALEDDDDDQPDPTRWKPWSAFLIHVILGCRLDSLGYRTWPWRWTLFGLLHGLRLAPNQIDNDLDEWEKAGTNELVTSNCVQLLAAGSNIRQQWQSSADWSNKGISSFDELVRLTVSRADRDSARAFAQHTQEHVLSGKADLTSEQIVVELLKHFGPLESII